MTYYFPLAWLVMNGLGVLARQIRLRGLVYGVWPPPPSSPATQSFGETKLPQIPQMLEVSMSTCTVRALAYLGQAGS